MENRTYRALDFSLRHVWIGPIFFNNDSMHHCHFHFVLARLVEAFPTTHCSFRVPLGGAQEFKYCMVRESHVAKCVCSKSGLACFPGATRAQSQAGWACYACQKISHGRPQPRQCTVHSALLSAATLHIHRTATWLQLAQYYDVRACSPLSTACASLGILL
jgi:hypothetical protein